VEGTQEWKGVSWWKLAMWSGRKEKDPSRKGEVEGVGMWERGEWDG